MEEIHHVRSLQGYPKQVLVPAGNVGDCSKAYLGAHSGEEYMLVDKKAIYCQLDILLELDELLGNLDNTLSYTLAILLDCIPFHFNNRLAPDHAALTSSMVTSVPVTTPVLTIDLKLEVEGNIVKEKQMFVA